jgi:hypothetical protein
MMEGPECDSGDEDCLAFKGKYCSHHAHLRCNADLHVMKNKVNCKKKKHCRRSIHNEIEKWGDLFQKEPNKYVIAVFTSTHLASEGENVVTPLMNDPLPQDL